MVRRQKRRLITGVSTSDADPASGIAPGNAAAQPVSYPRQVHDQELEGRSFVDGAERWRWLCHSSPEECFSVNDMGEGITAGDLPQIFERFYRAVKSRSRSRGGAGLGLTIAKTLVDAMDGEIGVESTVGQGSHFWFTLPVAASD